MFTHTTPDMSIVREEIFGPVTISIPFSDENEVIEAANDSEYGRMLPTLDTATQGNIALLNFGWSEMIGAN